ncbi:MAG: methyltransferase domain-containing protein [Planctomycetes bacterium]|nr:methyltransferase domain-containing protein [Planctomycetota bacterium]
MQANHGAWSVGILGAAVTHSVFRHLDPDGATAEELARKAGLSPRGAQALADGLLGLGLITQADGVYRNTPESAHFLIEGNPSYLGEFVLFSFADMTRWSKLPDVARTGVPSTNDTAETPENPFWEKLVTAIANLSAPLAQMAADRLSLNRGDPVRWLDVGGGSGIYSAIWLELNPKAQATQLDWPNVNGIAREFVKKFGVTDRFRTVDGDFHHADFGNSEYDIAIYSHIAHQETPPDNVATFRKFRRALKPGGTLLISDFVLNDDRSGHPFALMFASMMLLQTKGGSTYRKADYRSWLNETGFSSVEFVSTGMPATLIFAR